MKFQFRFAWNARSSPAFGPTKQTDQRRSVGTTVSGFDDFFRWCSLIQQRCTQSPQLQRWDAVQENTLFISFLSDLWFFMLCIVYSRVHLTFCQVRKCFCLLAYFAWHVFLYLNYVRWCIRFRTVLTEWLRLRLGRSVRTDLRLVHYPWHYPYSRLSLSNFRTTVGCYLSRTTENRRWLSGLYHLTSEYVRCTAR